MLERFWRKVDKNGPNGCWEWTGALRWNGYGAFKLDGKAQSSHRVAWVLINGAIPDGLLVCHTCDNRRCVDPKHLFIGTYSDNRKDALAKGRAVMPNLCGDQISWSKLTKDDIPIIRNRHASGDSYYAIAKDYPVSRASIRCAVLGVTWSHI